MTTPTNEQTAILTAARDTSDHLIIDAKAGSGKTFSLLQMLPLLRGTTTLQAFNRAIADELKAKVGTLGVFVAASVDVSTVHSHGLKALKRAGYKDARVQGGKLSFILRDQLKNVRADDPVHLNTRHVTKLAGLAKANGFGLISCDTRERFAAIGDHDEWERMIEHFSIDTELEGDFEPDDLIAYAQDLLMESNRNLRMIDFDDMIYLPLLMNLAIQQYDNVLIDEAQDINSTRRELAFRSMKPGGRLIAVGDPHQAIYGFTGAGTSSLDDIRKRLPASTTLPLSTCWRCDDLILAEARKIVPGIATAPAKLGKGLVKTIPFRLDDRDARIDMLAHPRPGDAILCRLNKPLVATCLGLLRRGQPARIEGRDIGAKLLGHVKKATAMYAHQPLADTLLDLDVYLVSEARKLIERKRETAVAMLEDEVDAAKLLIERCLEEGKTDYTALEALIATLFADGIDPRSLITLATVHKSKGREWPRVFILGRYDYMPFHRATLPWERVQEQNLIYVAITRAERELIYVTGVQSAIDQGQHRLAPLAGA